MTDCGMMRDVFAECRVDQQGLLRIATDLGRQFQALCDIAGADMATVHAAKAVQYIERDLDRLAQLIVQPI